MRSWKREPEVEPEPYSMEKLVVRLKVVVSPDLAELRRQRYSLDTGRTIGRIIPIHALTSRGVTFG